MVELVWQIKKRQVRKVRKVKNINKKNKNTKKVKEGCRCQKRKKKVLMLR